MGRVGLTGSPGPPSFVSSAVTGAVGDFSYDAVYDPLDAAFASPAGDSPATTMTRRKLFATLP